MAKSKMIMSLSFKSKEENMWNHIQAQFDAAYYIKMLIFNDMNNIKKETVITKKDYTEEIVIPISQSGYAEIDF